MFKKKYKRHHAPTYSKEYREAMFDEYLAIRRESKDPDNDLLYKAYSVSVRP